MIQKNTKKMMGFWPSGQEKAIGFEDSTPKIPSSALHSDGHQAQKDQQCHNCAKDHACFRCISSLKLQKESTQNQNHQQSPVNEQVKKSGHSCRPRFAKSYKTKTETSKEMHHQNRGSSSWEDWSECKKHIAQQKDQSKFLASSKSQDEEGASLHKLHISCLKALWQLNHYDPKTKRHK